MIRNSKAYMTVLVYILVIFKKTRKENQENYIYIIVKSS